MRISASRPGVGDCERFRAFQSRLAFSYPEVGKVTDEIFPEGYDHDRNEWAIGKGDALFQRVRLIIQSYDHFPADWAFLHATGEPPKVGLNVAVAIRQFGVWWLNGSRIVQVIDRTDFYGFSYGTLTSHVEKGEELFYVSKGADDLVYYGINAFSRPRFWGARLLKPYARAQQRRFVQESLQRIKEKCA